MRYLTLIVFFLSGILPAVSGQEDAVESSKSESLSFRIRNMNFIKNNEYSHPLIEGYTLTGYFFQPELIYSPSERFSLSLGAHILRYSGAGRFSAFRPLVSATYHFAPGAVLTLGTLSGSGTHRMYDPHFNKERIYNEWAEEGLQLNFSGDRLYNDTWLSWENFIFRGDSVREVFTAGESFRYSSSLIDGLFSFEIPLQLQFKHFGGQISDYPEPVETYFNLSAGAKVSFRPLGGRYGNAGFEYTQFLSDELTGSSTTGLSFGHAGWFRLNYEYRNLYLEAGYWIAGNYYAPNGNPIFGSVSGFGEGTIFADRRIATGTISYKLIPDSFFELFIGFDGYYDTRLRRFDSSATLHLKFDRLFRRRNGER